MSQNMTQRPFRLVMTTDAVGGIWRYSVDLAEALAEEGIEVILVGFGPRPSLDQQDEAKQVARLAWCDLPLDWQTQTEDDLAKVPDAIRRIVDHYAPDAVQVNLPSQADGLVLDVPVIAVAHSCVVTWFKAVHGTTEPCAWRWLRKKMLRGLNSADTVVAPSAAFADLLARCYGPLPHMRIVKNASKGVAGPARRRRFAMAAARWWDEGKNASVLDAAAADTLLPVKAAGQTAAPQGNAVTFAHVEALGQQSHATVAALLATAEIVISPSVYEPFGLVALEAATAGSALVLSDIPTYRELWNGCAIFFAPDDPHSLSTMVNGLIRDPELRDTLGANARARAAALTPARQAAEMASLYHAASAAPHQQRTTG